MLNVRRPLCVRALFLCLLAVMAAPAVKAQESQHPGLDRQLDRIDLGISGVGIFNNDSSGTATVNSAPTTVHLSPGNTLGALVNIRYVVKPLIGFEFNYGYARYTNTFTPFGTPSTPTVPSIGGVQQNASEYTFGYIAHLHPVFGLKTFAGAGLGTIGFRPTPRGGEGLPDQARAAYYYTAGVEQTVFSPHFGLRAQIRQVFYKAPDYHTNYLTIQQHTSTFEPGVGFYLHF